MTDNDKSLVERLRIRPLSVLVSPASMCSEAANRIEAQAAEIERLRGIVAVWLDLAIGPDEMGDYYHQKWAVKASQEALGETE